MKQHNVFTNAKNISDHFCSIYPKTSTFDIRRQFWHFWGRLYGKFEKAIPYDFLSCIPFSRHLVFQSDGSLSALGSALATEMRGRFLVLQSNKVTFNVYRVPPLLRSRNGSTLLFLAICLCDCWSPDIYMRAIVGWLHQRCQSFHDAYYVFWSGTTGSVQLHWSWFVLTLFLRTYLNV